MNLHELAARAADHEIQERNALTCYAVICEDLHELREAGLEERDALERALKNRLVLRLPHVKQEALAILASRLAASMWANRGTL